MVEGTGTGTGNGAPDRPHVRGQILLARFEYVKEQFGPESVETVMSALPTEHAALLRGVDREQWYPFATLIALDQAIATTVHAGDALVFETLGLASARHRTEWLGEHARLVSVHTFLSRVADEHSSFHTFGHSSYHRTGFSEGEIAFSEYPESYASWCQSARGYFKGAIECLTGDTGEVDEISCQGRGDSACVFRARWSALGRASHG